MQIYTVYLTFSALLAVHKEFWVKNITVILSCCVCSVEVSLLEHVAVMLKPFQIFNSINVVFEIFKG